MKTIEQFDYISTDNIYKQMRAYAYLIGKFLIKFSEIEHEINLGISQIIFDDSDEQGYRLIKYLSTSNKIEFLCNSYRNRCFYYDFPTQQDKETTKKLIDNLKGSLKTENSFRNIVAHANWISLTRKNFVRTKIIEREDKVVVKLVKITPEILKDHINRLEEILNNLEEIQEEFNF